MTTSLAYWNPTFRRTHFDRLFNRAFNEFLGDADTPEARALKSRTLESTASSNWTPAVDIRETESSITLFAELPGLNKKDVELRLEDSILTISGERTFEKTDDENYHRIERTFGSFTRTFSLPKNVDASQVEAKFNDGILTVELPKTEETKPRAITIK